MELLIDNGAEINELDLTGYSPLLCALLTFKFDIVKVLIKRGSRLSVMTQDGNTAVHVVILSNNPAKWECLDLLLKNGCDKDQCNDMGQSPTHLACLRQDIDSLRILMSAGANPNTADRLGITPLAYCISNGMEYFAHLLIDGGAKEDLDKLKIHRISESFRKNLLQRLHNPPSLLELSRTSLSQHFGPHYRDWATQHRDLVPRQLHPFMKFEQSYIP